MAINSSDSALGVPTHPTAVKPDLGRNETAIETLAHTCM